MVRDVVSVRQVADTVNGLCEVLGPHLLADACDVTWRQIDAWSRGDSQPDEDQLERTMAADQVVDIVCQSDGPIVA